MKTDQPKYRPGIELIGDIPLSLDTPNHQRELLEAVRIANPGESELREFLRRASLATPEQARTAVRQIVGRTCTFEASLQPEGSDCTCKSSKDRTTEGEQGVPCKKDGKEITEGEGKFSQKGLIK